MTTVLSVSAVALREVWSRLLRSALTALGIAIAVGMYVAVDSGVSAFERALVNNVAAVQAHLEVSEKETLDFLSSIVPESVEARVSSDPAVAQSSPMLVRLLSILPGYSVPVLGWKDDSFLWDSVSLIQGRKPAAAAEPEVVIGTAIAKRLNAGPGRRMRLGGDYIVKVVGVFDTPSQINRTAVILLLADLQAMTNRAGQATSIGIKLTPEGLQNIEAVRARIGALVPEFSVVNTDVLARENVLLVMTRAFAQAMQVMVLTLAFFATANTVWTAVREKRHEFAIMRVFGWSLRRIGFFLAVQSFAVTAAGFVGGAVLGSLGAYALGHFGPTAAFLEPQIELSRLLWAGGAALAVSLLATAMPVWMVARMDPAAVLRSS